MTARSTRRHNLDAILQSVHADPPQEDGFVPITLHTHRGQVHARYYPAAGATRAAIYVGGVGGGFDTPGGNLYPRLCRELQDHSIAGLRVQFRYPTILEEAVSDVLAGLVYLKRDGIEQFALVGHSFGGAVGIQAAAASGAQGTVVTLASQSYGADAVGTLAPHFSLLLLHGLEDQTLPAACSVVIYEMAHQPKKILLLEGADHGLDPHREQVFETVRDWIVTKLKAD